MPVLQWGKGACTLGARGFSCAVSGVGHVSVVTHAPETVQEKPLAPRVRCLLKNRYSLRVLQKLARNDLAVVKIVI